MFLLFVFAGISIVFSFLCSVWEAVLLSITPAYAEVKLKEGGFVGEKLKEFKENIDRPLSAILTLNTVAHTVGAMGVGAQAAMIWKDSTWKWEIDFFGYYTLSVGMEAIVAVIMTMAILYISEIFPKTIGANNWRGLAPFTVRSLNIIIKALYPLVWFSQLITKFLKKDKSKSVLSRADFTAMTDIAEKGGELKKNESKIIRNLLGFDKVLAKDVMTPRTVVVAAEENTTIREFYDNNKNLRFSRVPLYQGSKDHIAGYFLKDHLLSALIEKKDDSPLSSIKRELMVVNEEFPIPELFNRFTEKREHIALVVDNFGGMSGLASLEDVIETLLGLEIVDEFDGTEDMQILARQRWEKRAKALGIIEEKSSESEEGNE